MLNINVSTTRLSELKAEVCIVLVIKNHKDELVNKSLFTRLDYQYQSPLFDQVQNMLYVPIEDFSMDCLREAGSSAIRALKNYPFKSAKIKFYENAESMSAFALGALLGEYSYDVFKSKKNPPKLKTLTISTPKTFNKHLLARINILAQSINTVRDLINTPPQIATPQYLATHAQQIAKKLGIECKILKKPELKKEQMNALLAVSRASNKSPRLIHLTYKPTKQPQSPQSHTNAFARIVLVGKGLTYDSGGLSLKPADYMTTMKADKSGGCAVMGIIQAVAELGLAVEVHSIVGAVENMIGGNAYKPDDVLISREGKSIEVRNTDAEGRLVLADCLSYAQDLKPDILIDFATLTGACVVGLGEYTSGIMGYNDDLKASFEKAALESGELVATLPFNRHIKKLIESKIADVCNVSQSRYGGAISAGMFLGEFIRDEYRDKWLHIDIAGPAFVEKEWDINPYGASGAGVRAGVAFIEAWLKNPSLKSKNAPKTTALNARNLATSRIQKTSTNTRIKTISSTSRNPKTTQNTPKPRTQKIPRTKPKIDSAKKEGN